ncbi:MAG: urate hydroxylase PuuD [Bdellovibrionaceae bacterium]|nr:urate hydroxylase PuuD [Pseudobdellovibrionaceae bacterium]
MASSLDLWIEYILRFSHLVAGISWIGSSFYFIWLDSSFLPPEKSRRNVEGEVFMVHGGFYYQVDKKKIFPGEIPKILHWFKWEATLTWITGFFLFAFLYYLKGASLLIDQQKVALSQGQAIGLSIGLVIGCWLLYDLIWNASIVKSKITSVILSLLGFVGLVYSSVQIFSGRGAFILVGVIMGSLMLLNVWVRILPGQAKMLREATAGQIPDYSVSLKSKIRSVHNTYFIFPVLFIMLSNHYPLIYNHHWNWILLIILSVSGALVRHAMVTKSANERWTLLPASVGLMALVFVTAHAPAVEKLNHTAVTALDSAQVRVIIDTRCVRCHATHNTDENFKVAGKNVILETEEQIRQHKDMMIKQVESKVMPLGNLTQMTDEERASLLDYLRKL